MRQRTLHYLFLIVVMGIGLAGCKSDVNLGDVTVDSKVNARLSLPIGEVSVKFADLMGMVNEGMGISINEDGVLEYNIYQHYDREFHKIVLTDYVGNVESDVRLADDHPELLVTGIPAGTESKPEFEMEINFNGVNDDLSDERLDSMAIESAEFTTRVSSKDVNIQNEDIQKVVMKLGSQFRRAAGTEIELPGFALDTDVPIVLDDFTLVMMKDVTKEPGNDNVINKANITFVIYLKPQNNVAITATSGFHFTFKVEFMEYSALYGYFEPGTQTSHADEVGVPFSIPGGEAMVLPIKEPQITLKFTYGLSMPLSVRVNEISAIHPDGTKTYATWGGSSSSLLQLYSVLPVNAPLDATIQDSSIMMNKEPQNGAIDRFFLKEVKKLGYDYKLEVDKNRVVNGAVMKQFRMTQNTKFGLDFNFKMPFIFNPGLNVAYSDTIKDIDLSRADLDSLAAMTNGIITSIDSAELALYLVIENNIPVDMQLDAVFLDENESPLALDQLKDIKIEGATMSGSQVTAAKTVKTVAIHTADFDKIAKTKAIKFRARVGDDQKPSTFLADQKLKIKLGVTGDVQAILNLNLSELTNN